MASTVTQQQRKEEHGSPVEFFDIASKTGASWSPNTTKTRLVLNYKSIPHSTTWLSYPDIAPTLSSLQVPPATSGRAKHTCPAIRHGTVVLQDSWPIAVHLDQAFPSSLSIFPTAGALPLAQLVHQHLYQRVVPTLVLGLLLPKIPAILEERGADYFRRTRSEWFGKPLDQLRPEDPEDSWKRLEEELAIFSDALTGLVPSSSGSVVRVERPGPFFLGDVPSYADFILVAFFAWFKHADDKDWERLMTFGKDGCFRKLWDSCEQWLHVQK